MLRVLLFFMLLGGIFLTGCKEGAEDPGEEGFNQMDEDGRKQGVWRYYYSSGELKAEVHYEDDIRMGQETQYFPSGAVNVQRNWIGDTLGEMLDGPYSHYYENGQVLHEMFYDEGIPDSMFTYYYENGKVERDGSYAQGVKTGLWSFYNREGNLLLTIDYEGHGQYWTEDTPAGVYTWYRSGNPYYKAVYAAGQIVEDSVLIPAIYEAKKDSLPYL